MPGKVNLVAPNGRVIPVKSEDVATFQKLGYRQETIGEMTDRTVAAAKKANYEDQKGTTFLEGVGAGLSLGFSDLYGSQEGAYRAQYNPGTRLVGEIGAIVGTSLVAPGTLAGRAAALTPAGLATGAGRLAGRLGNRAVTRVALEGAVEGGIQGAGQVIGNYGLHGDPLTVESVLAGVGTGTVLGTGAGVLGHGMVKGGRALLSPAKAVDAVDNAAVAVAKPIDAVSDVAYKDLRAIVGDIKAETKAAQQEAEGLLDSLKKHNSLMKKKGQYNSVTSAMDSGAARDEALYKLGLKPRTGEVMSKGPLDIGPLLRDVKGRADQLFDNLALDPALSKSAAKEISDVRKLRTIFDEVLKGPNANPVQAARYYDDYFAAVERLSVKAGEPLNLKYVPLEAVGGKVYKKLATGPTQRATGKLLDGIESESLKAASASDSFSPEIMGSIQSRLDTLKAASEVSELLPSLPKSKEEFFNMSKKDRIRFADALERVAKLEKFTPSAKRLMDKLDEITAAIGVKAEGTSAAKFKAGIDAINDAPKKVKASGEGGGGGKGKHGSVFRMLNGALARQGSQLMAKHAPGFLKPAARAIGWELGRNAAAFMAGTILSGGDIKGGVVAAISLRARVLQRIKKAAGLALVGGGKAMGKSSGALTVMLDSTSLKDKDKPSKNLREAAKAHAEEIHALALSARDLAFKGLDEIRAISPEMADAMDKKLAEDIAYLSANFPKDPGNVMIGTKSRWEMSEQQARMVAETSYGVLHPLEAYEDFIEGTLSPYAMRGFKDRWPELHQLGNAEIISHPDFQKTLDNSTAYQRSHLSHILGAPVSSLQDPRITKSLQEDLLNAPNRGMERQQSAPNKPSNNAQTLQSPAQRLIDR